MYTRSYGEDEVINAALLQELGEERRPVGLNLDVGRLHDRSYLLGLQFGRSNDQKPTQGNAQSRRGREGRTRTVMGMPSSWRMRAA